MRVWALCSWFDEQPEHLERMAASLAGLVDGIVAVDGAYATYPGERVTSAPEQYRALARGGIDIDRVVFHDHGKKWEGGEVEKRAFMFKLALEQCEPNEDWFIILDGDMSLAPGFNADTVRAHLALTELDVAELLWLDIPWDEDYNRASRTFFRSLFRALPGLTVEGYHWIYTCYKDGRRYFPWQSPDKRFEAPPALDLTQLLTMEHRQAQREETRDRTRRTYYEARDQSGLEFVPDYSADVR